MLGLTASVGSVHAAPLKGEPCANLYAAVRAQYPARAAADLARLPDVGVEIEGIAPRAQTLERMRDGLARRARARYPDAQISPAFEVVQPAQGPARREYTFAYERGGHRYSWKVTEDASIEKPAGFRDVEFVSPRLRDGEDLALFGELVAELRARGVRARPRSAGVHVHVDFADANRAEALGLLTAFSHVEPAVVAGFGQATERVPAARPIAPEVLGALPDLLAGKLGALDRVGDFRAFLGFLRDRARTLNPKSLYRHGTVEFRLFNSTLDAVALDVVIDFTRRFVRAVRARDPALVAYLDRFADRPRDVDLDEVARLIGMKRLPSEVGELFRRELELERVEAAGAAGGAKAAITAVVAGAVVKYVYPASAVGEGASRDAR